jgi:tripartite-type tricarboxylate transporter receptor subunit TctC
LMKQISNFQLRSEEAGSRAGDVLRFVEASMNTKRFLLPAGLFCVIAAADLVVWSIGAAAQTYPNRSIRFVVPSAAGGPVDIYARAIAEKLSASLKSTFVVENRPGAGGNIGAEVVAKAAPDGHVLGLVLGTVLTFDPDKDFRPIAITTTGGNMLVVHPSVPVNSVAEFVAFAKAAAAQKQPISYASGGIGNPGHLAMESFRLHAGFDAVHVPYRGAAPLVVDLLAGQVKVAFVTSAGTMEHVRAGRLKALGLSLTSRSPLAADVPTIAESGFPGFRVENYSVMLAPAGIPEPTAALLERELVAALAFPDVIERLRGMDAAPAGITGPQVRARLKADRADWEKVVQAAGMRPE